MSGCPVRFSQVADFENFIQSSALLELAWNVSPWIMSYYY